jgi:hypothetical protein
MKSVAAIFLFIAFADVSTRLEPAIPYFTNVRDVLIAQPDRQNFFVLDEELWAHSRPDLGDLRLYDGDSPVQYAVSEQRAGISSEEVVAGILNLGSVDGHTEFDLDTQSLPEYDRIHLRLDAHDFIATASVSGGAAPGKGAEVQLPPSTLYDFSKEQLGSNSQLKLPTSSFRYLHIKLSSGIRPEQVKSASISNLHEQRALWTKAGSCSAPQQKHRMTVIACDVPQRVPLSRVEFHVDPAQVNLRRTVSVEDSKGSQIASGEISRVRMKRGDTLVTNEDLSINLSEDSGSITINIDNGDNPPVNITSTDPLSLERRIYFEPQGKSALRLFYGDEKLTAPVYDYARFFHADSSAGQAQLGPGAHNPLYAGRPDARPWSERHTAILWSAMLVVVLTLALLAFRGLRTGIPQ